MTHSYDPIHFEYRDGRLVTVRGYRAHPKGDGTRTHWARRRDLDKRQARRVKAVARTADMPDLPAVWSADEAHAIHRPLRRRLAAVEEATRGLSAIERGTAMHLEMVRYYAERGAR